MKLVVIFLLNLGFLLCRAAEKPKVGVVNVLPRNPVKNEENALDIEITPPNGPWVLGKLGFSLPSPSAISYSTLCETDSPDEFCVQWGDYAKVYMRPGRDADRCTRFEWTSTHARQLEDCYQLDPDVHGVWRR